MWQGISERVFRHADPAKTAPAGNAADAGPQEDHFAYETNAYARNVFYDAAQLGVFGASGRWLMTLDDFRTALRKQHSLAASLGQMDEAAMLADPAQGDFRLNRQSAAVDQGAVAFVPWALHGVVAEWNFYPAGDDLTQIIDEHWYAKDFMTDRIGYHACRTYPLTAVNVESSDYVDGVLENFAAGALQFTPARKTYATIRHAGITQPFTVKLATRCQHGQDPQAKEFTFAGDDLKTADVHASNFLVEVFFKADGDGLLVGKHTDTGYALQIHGGRAKFGVAAEAGVAGVLMSKTKVTDGRWHHLIAEADREAQTLTLYVDGKLDATGRGIGSVSLANEGDLFVGGRPDGRYLPGAIDFLRIAHGTLADAHTTIEELYAWQFHGPALHDMCGASPKGQGRDAGAIESF